MIATFVIDWPVLLLIGLLFGGFAPDARWWRGRAWAAGLVTALAFTATAIAGYLIAPDWMWMYFLDPSDVAWTVPFVVAAYPFAFVVAFAAAGPIRRASRAAWIASLAACAALEIVVLAATWSRYAAVGTAQEWVQGAAHDLVTLSPTGPARSIGVLAPLFAAVLVAALLAVRKDAREAATRR